MSEVSVTLTRDEADEIAAVIRMLWEEVRGAALTEDRMARFNRALAALTREPEAGVSSRAELLKLFEAVELAVDRIDGVDAYAQGGYRQAAREYDEARRAMKAALTREEPAVCAGCKDDHDLAEWMYDPEKQDETLEDLPDPPPHTCEKASPTHPDPALSRGTPVSPLNEPLNGGRPRKNCQTGSARICARTDGVLCPDDSCDIDDGIYPKPVPAPCQHRELLRHLVTTLDQAPGSLPRCVPIDGGWGEWLAVLADSLGAAKAALNAAQPCAAQGDAGEWEPVSRILVDERCDWVRRRMEEAAMEFKAGDQMGIMRRRAKGGGA